MSGTVALRAAGPPDASNSLPVANAVEVDQAPRLDGTLDDPIWHKAKPITAFLQREPHQGQPATMKTEVYIVYTGREVFFGIFCHDPDPNNIVATELPRDNDLQLDDSFEILIDPTHGERDAYDFAINPLGTRRDGLIREGAGGFGPPPVGWNGIWTSSAHIVPGGWIATIGIPFFTLNVSSSKNMIWGLNLRRFIREKNEEDLWSAWRRQYGPRELSQEGSLQGLENLEDPRLLVIKPYALTGFRHLPPGTSDPTLGSAGMNFLHTGGVDAQLGLRSNVVANFTVNTDFATAEADQTQFSLSPYPLFYPERRQFFLENAGVFAFSMGGGGGGGGGGRRGGGGGDLLFFSRQIGINASTGDQVPVNGGAKVTGTLGAFDFGAMDVETRAKGDNPYANFAVVRLKRALFGSSYIGVMGIDKRSGDPNDPYNQTGGVDTRLLLHRNISIYGFAAATRSPGVSGGNMNVGGSVRYNTDWFNVGASRNKVGSNFNPEVGFIRRTDCLCNSVDAMIRPRPNIPGVREVDFRGSFQHASSTAGLLETQQWNSSIQLRFNSGARLGFDLVQAHAQQINHEFNIYKDVVIQPGLYRWMSHRINYSSPQNWRATFDLSEQFGSYYDGHLNIAQANVNYRASEHWTFGLNQQWNRFRLPEGNFSVVFGGARIDYSFSRFFTVSSFVQMNTSHTQAVSANVLVRWHYRPDSDIYLVYTSGPRFASNQGNSTTVNQNELVLKYTYSFNPCSHCTLGTNGRHARLGEPPANPRPLHPNQPAAEKANSDGAAGRSTPARQDP